ncbi:MAG TPA: TonB-dependent receptor, partial [Polyangiales bacterium]|nr:TonB-dependent receptor [Polyangiales bacterium]
RVRRFHDAYRAYGATAELGVVDQPWAEQLIVQGFSSGYTKQLPHNLFMTVPYGEARTSEVVHGGLVRYRNAWLRRIKLELIGSVARRQIELSDKSRWVYDWFGRRASERRVRGEIDTPPTDQTVFGYGGFGRATLESELARGHWLTFNSSPQYGTRSGKQHLRVDPSTPDPLSGDRSLLTIVTGLEYKLHFLEMPDVPVERETPRDEDYRFETAAFVKWYSYLARSEALTPAYDWSKRRAHKESMGGGGRLRVHLTNWLMVKLTYEFATRMPTSDEIFGDGALVSENYELKPETSHNLNLGPFAELKLPKLGQLVVDLNAFLRDTRDQIVQLGNMSRFQNRNLSRARSVGLEGALQWTSRGRYLSLQSSLTYQDQRNRASAGTFAQYRGDRIPNRPWLFASWAASLRFAKLLSQSDELEPFYQGRYVHDFYRGWQSIGVREFKDVVPAQVSHNLGLTYGFGLPRGHLDLTFEAQNVSDA